MRPVKTLDVEIDLGRHSVRKQGILLALLASEWQVLAVLAQKAASVVSLLELQEATGQNVFMVRARVGTLRLRLEDDPKHPRLLTTVPGRGYRLELLP